jgi:hypothetical protein
MRTSDVDGQDVVDAVAPYLQASKRRAEGDGALRAMAKGKAQRERGRAQTSGTKERRHA